MSRPQHVRLAKREVVKTRPEYRKPASIFKSPSSADVHPDREYISGTDLEEIIRLSLKDDPTPVADRGEKLDVMIAPYEARMLMRRNVINRGLKPTKIEQYTCDMNEGRWHYSHQGIGFDWNGHLLDGQHRLLAVIESQTTQPFQVTLNLDPKTREYIDQGANRSIADVASLATGRKFDSHLTAIAARMMGSIYTQTTTAPRAAIIEYIMRHEDAIRYGCSALPMNLRFARSSLRAVIARAYYRANDREALERFCEVIKSGRYEPGEEAAIVLREAFLKQTDRSKKAVVKEYCYAEYALLRFLEGKPIANNRSVEYESLPVPGEEVKMTK